MDRSLTARECEVVEFVSQGMSNEQIGMNLAVTENTVKNYVRRIFDRTRVMNRTQLAVWWITEGKKLYSKGENDALNR